MEVPSRSRLGWLGFAVILLHNLEEAVTAPRWIAAHGQELRIRFALERIPAADAGAFYTSLTVLTIVILFWIAAASRASERGFGVYSLTFLFAVFFCNALVPHLAGAVLLGAYVPGVLTAVLLVIPFTILWSVRALREGWASATGFVVTIAAAAVLYALAVGSLLGLESYNADAPAVAIRSNAGASHVSAETALLPGRYRMMKRFRTSEERLLVVLGAAGG